MKIKSLRIIPVLLILLSLLVSFSLAFAEETNFSSLSNDELILLQEKVNAEIVSRGIAKTAKLSKGTYIAGEDLPCGSYIYTCMAKGDDWGNVTVYSERGRGSQLLWEVVSAPDNGEEAESFFVTLSEGDELKSGVPFSLTIYTGILFE